MVDDVTVKFWFGAEETRTALSSGDNLGEQ